MRSLLAAFLTAVVFVAGSGCVTSATPSASAEPQYYNDRRVWVQVENELLDWVIVEVEASNGWRARFSTVVTGGTALKQIRLMPGPLTARYRVMGAREWTYAHMAYELHEEEEAIIIRVDPMGNVWILPAEFINEGESDGNVP